jgi:hypothetical protein
VYTFKEIANHRNKTQTGVGKKAKLLIGYEEWGGPGMPYGALQFERCPPAKPGKKIT